MCGFFTTNTTVSTTVTCTIILTIIFVIILVDPCTCPSNFGYLGKKINKKTKKQKNIGCLYNKRCCTDRPTLLCLFLICKYCITDDWFWLDWQQLCEQCNAVVVFYCVFQNFQLGHYACFVWSFRVVMSEFLHIYHTRFCLKDNV